MVYLFPYIPFPYIVLIGKMWLSFSLRVKPLLNSLDFLSV